MPVPAVNLRPSIEATSAAWKVNLDRLFERSHFILGEQVEAFEREFAAHEGARAAIGVGSGTAAIELCLRQAGIHGEVLTTPLTAPFTGIAILAAGCRLRFADVDAGTLLLDPAASANRVTKKTAAIVPVHLYGQPCDLPAFRRLARESGAALIQDACQAHGARFRGRPFTDFSDHVAYSFYPTKNLPCLGDGGAVLTNRAVKAARLRMLRDGGRRGGQVSYVAGVNSRLDEMQACYLRAFLPRLDEWNAHRARIAALYDEGLAGCGSVRLVARSPDSVNHLYVIRAQRRDHLRRFLASRGIGAGVHYPVPLHLQPAFQDASRRRGDFPIAEKACREILSLPLWPYMPETAAREVIDRVVEFYR